MYCETATEKTLHQSLIEQFPQSNEYLLDLIAWVFINKPDRFEEIMVAHRENALDMIDLADVDIAHIQQI